MTSFLIEDPKSTITPTRQTVGGKEQVEGRVTFVVRNTTGLNRSAKIAVMASGDDLPFLTLVGAAPTDPGLRYIDFSARQVQNVEVAAAVPLGAAARQVSLRIRATLDGDSDNDSIDSRPVTLDVPAQAVVVPPTKPTSRFPLWAIIACVALVLVVGGIATWVLRPKFPDFKDHSLQEVAAYFRAQGGKVAGKLVPAYAVNGPNDPKIADQKRVETVDGVDRYVFVVSFGPPTNNPCSNLILFRDIKTRCLLSQQPQAQAAIQQSLQGSNLSF